MTRIQRFARTYMLQYLHWYVGGIVAIFVTNWIATTIPLYVADGIDALARGDANAAAKLVEVAAIVGGLGLFTIIIRTLSRLLFFTPGRLVEANVKHDLFATFLRHQPEFLDQWPTGDLISRTSSDTNMLRLLAGFTALGIFNTGIAFLLTGVQMVRISPMLTLWICVPMAIGFAITQIFIRQFHQVMRDLQQQAGALSDLVLSSYQGVASIQAFGAEDAFVGRFDSINDEYLATNLRRANLRTAIGPVLSLAASTNVFVLLFVGGPMAMEGAITVGELVAFTTLVAYLTGPMRGMSFILSLFKQAEASLERIDAILLTAPLRPEGDNPVAPSRQAPTLTLKNLAFTYPEANEPTLQDISLEVPAGSTLGILGPTGAGKTTLLRTIARLYNPPRGSILVDGHDINDLDLDAWRQRMAFVPQRAFLFSETVRENILMGHGDDATLERVLDEAQLTVDMAALPHGVATEVGEAGLTLSGGQRQRTALARGLVRDPSLLILDDVLSAVDHSTEHQLISALRARDNRPTTIIVAHRISALQHADQIAVLDHGRLVDVGTHETLCERDGLYREIWLRQQEAE